MVGGNGGFEHSAMPKVHRVECRIWVIMEFCVYCMN